MFSLTKTELFIKRMEKAFDNSYNKNKGLKLKLPFKLSLVQLYLRIKNSIL